MLNEQEKWFDYIENPLAYTSYYSNPDNDLILNLQSLNIEWEESGVIKTDIILNGTLIKFPDRLPERWVINKYNLAKIELKLFSFNTIKLLDDLRREKAGDLIDKSRHKEINIIKISISRLMDGQLLVKGAGDASSFEITCLSVQVNKVNGYQEEEIKKAYW